MGAPTIDSFKLATLGNLDELLTSQPVEEYLSYDAKKKADEEKLQ
jgi:hypothetical protein